MLNEEDCNEIHSDFAYGLSPDDIIRHSLSRNSLKDADDIHKLIDKMIQVVNFCTYSGELVTHFGGVDEELTASTKVVASLPCHRPCLETRKELDIEDRIFPYRQTLVQENCSHISETATITPCDYGSYQKLVSTEILKSALACKIPLGIKTIHTSNYRKLIKTDSGALYAKAVLLLKTGNSFEQVAQQCSIPIELVRGVWGDYMWQAEWIERKLLKLPYVSNTFYGLVTGKFKDTNVEGAPAVCLSTIDRNGEETFVAYTSIPVRDKDIPLLDEEGKQERLHGHLVSCSRYVVHGKVDEESRIPQLEKITSSEFLEELEYCRDVPGFRDDLLKAVQ